MIYRFSGFELDESLYELRRQGEALKLSPKVFDVLLYLVRHRDRVVSKEELLGECWAGEIVTESVLPTNITAARKALGDERAQAKLIQTIHGRGYRFVADVEEGDDGKLKPRQDSPQPAAFVGREDVMSDLRAQLDEIFDGKGRLVMLVGEPGIGKTRTAEELSRDAAKRGARVFAGRCYEGEGAPAFWPWLQLLRGAIEGVEGGSLQQRMGAGAADIATLVPEIRAKLPNLPGSPPVDSDQVRFRLFESVTRFFREESRENPLVLLLDDLHWADEPTLLLFQFLAREIRFSRILLIGAYRDVDVRRQHPLAGVLGELARESHFHRVALHGLSESEVGRFIQNATGSGAPAGLVTAVFGMTEGNPFFIHEITRLLAPGGQLQEPDAASLEGVLPQGVRDVIGRRLDLLSEDCNDVLRAASILGREFRLVVLEGISQRDAEDLLTSLDEAIEARIIGDGAAGHGNRLGSYVFSHGLIRETLYEELTGPQRVQLHRRAGETLEQVYGADLDEHLPELAHHFFQAAPGGDINRAIEYAGRAAVRALELLAYEEAASHYVRALEALDLRVPIDEARRAEISLALGQAQSLAGRTEEAKRTFRRVAEMARSLRAPDLLGHAAMGIGSWPLPAGTPPMDPNEEFRSMVEEALDAIGSEHDALRARLISGLAVTPPDQDSMERREELSRYALELARRADDPDALFDALYARQWALSGPGDSESRLELSTEILELAHRTGSKEKEFTAHEDRARSYLVLGRMEDADREIAACEKLAEDLRLPAYHWSTLRFQIARSMMKGQFTEGEALIEKTTDLGYTDDPVGSSLIPGIWRVLMLFIRGQLAQVEALFESFVDENAWLDTTVRAFVAFLYSELGRDERALRHFELIAPRLPELTRDEHWLPTIFLAGQTCANLGDREHADALYELFKPHAHLNMSHQTGRVFLGSGDMTIGRLAGLLGREEEAERHFEAGLERNALWGARPILALTQFYFAQYLLGAAPGQERSKPPSAADRQRAHSLLAEAEHSAREMGMESLRAQSAALSS